MEIFSIGSHPITFWLLKFQTNNFSPLLLLLWCIVFHKGNFSFLFVRFYIRSLQSSMWKTLQFTKVFSFDFDSLMEQISEHRQTINCIHTAVCLFRTHSHWLYWMKKTNKFLLRRLHFKQIQIILLQMSFQRTVLSVTMLLCFVKNFLSGAQCKTSWRRVLFFGCLAGSMWEFTFRMTS